MFKQDDADIIDVEPVDVESDDYDDEYEEKGNPRGRIITIVLVVACIAMAVAGLYVVLPMFMDVPWVTRV